MHYSSLLQISPKLQKYHRNFRRIPLCAILDVVSADVVDECRPSDMVVYGNISDIQKL